MVGVDIEGAGLSFFASCMLAYGLLAAWLGLAVHARKTARRARLRHRTALRVLANGDHTETAPLVFSGTIEAKRPDVPVVVVDIVERLRRPFYRGFTFDIERAEAQAFELRIDDGRTIAIDPRGPVDIHCDPRPRSVPGEWAHRTSIALAAGTRLTVTGHLVWDAGNDDAFRHDTGGATPALRPPRDGTLKLSTRDQAPVALAQEMRSARFYAVVAAFWLLACAPFHLLTLLGARTEGEALTTRPSPDRVFDMPCPRGHARVHVTVVAVLGSKGATELEGDVCDGRLYPLTAGSRAPLVAWPAWPAVHQLGPSPSLTFGQTAIGVMLTIFLALGAFMAVIERPLRVRVMLGAMPVITGDEPSQEGRS
ncbi:Hypothetical protein A7982_06526 [Minicystis rosea]|nr:Hypothetical protein A7982_06526 [Minicystis rosea]